MAILLATLSRGFIVDEFKEIAEIADTVENQFFDFRYKKTLKTDKKSNHIALLSIDDESLEKMGRWPWSRSQWKPVLNKLKNYGAKIVAYDILFSEPQLVCNAESPDQLLLEGIQNFNSAGGHVILPYTLASQSDPIMQEVPGELFEFIMDSEIRPPLNSAQDAGNMSDENNPNHILPSKLNRTTFPLELLRTEGNGYGYLNTSADRDGVYRHFAAAANVDYLYFPSLALATYQLYTGDRGKLLVNHSGQSLLELASGKLELNHAGEARVKFYGSEKQFSEVSVYKLIQSQDNDPEIQKELEGKIVFIALTAIGNANDIRPTPISPQTPGVLMHMNLAQSLIQGDFFKFSSDSLKYSAIIMISGIILIILFQLFNNPLVDLLVVLCVCGLTVYLDYVYFLPQSYELKLFFCLASFTLTYIWNTFLNFYLASNEKKHIRGAFSQMVAPSIVDELLKHPEKLKLGGEKKEITVFFSDVRDFTTISEKLTPEELTHALNIYMTRMTNILIHHGGTLDKYIGDAIVGYWGAPVALQYHAYHAIKAAQAQLEALPEINQQLREQNLPEFKIGIGLNSGVCSVGNMGSDQIMQYTALGDNMNLGARLEGLCKPYHSKLLISEFTYNMLNDDQKKEFVIRRMDKVRVKGKEKAVEILEVLDNTHPLYKESKVITSFNQAFQLYLDKKFSEVIDLLHNFSNSFDDFAINSLIEKCQYNLKNPPNSDWDGTTTFTTK